MSKKEVATSGFWRFVICSPITIPALFVMVCIYCMTLLLLRQLTSINVVIGTLLICIASLFFIKSVSLNAWEVKREDKLVFALLVAGLIGWIGLNARYTAQNIFVYRDPALY